MTGDSLVLFTSRTRRKGCKQRGVGFKVFTASLSGCCSLVTMLTFRTHSWKFNTYFKKSPETKTTLLLATLIPSGLCGWLGTHPALAVTQEEVTCVHNQLLRNSLFLLTSPSGSLNHWTFVWTFTGYLSLSFYKLSAFVLWGSEWFPVDFTLPQRLYLCHNCDKVLSCHLPQCLICGFFCCCCSKF